MANNPYGLSPQIQEMALSLGLGREFGLTAPTPKAPARRPGFKQITLPDQTTLEIPEQPNEEEKYRISLELAQRFPKEYGSLLDPYQTLGGGAAEFFKGIPRGFASSLIGAAQGVVGAVTPGNDTELELNLAAAQRYLEEDSVLAPEEPYKDFLATKLGAGLGSVATYAMPGGIAKALGASATGVAARSAGLGLAVAGGTGEQAQRILQERELGKAITTGQEIAGLIGGGGIGATEMIPINRLFSKVTPETGSALLNIFSRLDKRSPLAGSVSDDIIRLTKSAFMQGTAEGLQEALAGVGQNIVSNVAYDAEIEIGESFLDDLQVGGGVGAIADVIVDAMGGRRTVANKLYRDKEELLRRKRIERFNVEDAEDLRNKRMDEMVQRGQTDPGILMLPPPSGTPAAPSNEGVYTVSLAGNPDRFTKVTVFSSPDGQGGISTIAYSPEGDGYYDITDELAGGRSVEDAVALAAAGDLGIAKPSKEVPEGVAFGAVRKGLSVSKDGNIPAIEPARILSAIQGGRISTPNEDSFIKVQPLGDGTFGLVNVMTATPVTDKQYASVNDAFVDLAEINNQNAAISAANVLRFTGLIDNNPAYRMAASLRSPKNRLVQKSVVAAFLPKEKRVGMKDFYSPEEAKKLLGPKDFDEMMQSFAQVTEQNNLLENYVKRDVLVDPNFANKRTITASVLNKLGKDKNLKIDVKDKAFRDYAKYWTGTENWGDMSNGQRTYLMTRIANIPAMPETIKFPNLFRRQYTRTQFEAVLGALGTAKDGKTPSISVKDIQAATGLSEDGSRQLYSDLLFSGRVKPVVPGKIQLIRSEQDYIADRKAKAAGLIQNETVEQAAARMRGAGFTEDSVKRVEQQAKQAVTDPKTPTAQVKQEAEKREEAAVEQGADPQAERVATNFDKILADALNRYGIAKFVKHSLNTVEAKTRKLPSGQTVMRLGYFSPIKKSIVINIGDQLNDPNVSTEAIIDRIISTVDHETIHAMREADMFTEQEWNTLSNFVRTAKINRAYLDEAGDKSLMLKPKDRLPPTTMLDEIRLRYADKGLNEMQLVEEAVAESFRMWRKHGGKFAAGKPASLFQRILNFIQSFAGAWKGSGATSVDQIFSAIADGEIGARTPGLSIFNPDANATIRSLNFADQELAKVKKIVNKGERRRGPVKIAQSDLEVETEADPNQERNDAFKKLADAQRGRPEIAMLSVQSALKKKPFSEAAGNGPLNYLVEHVGDLTHRMAENYATWSGGMGVEYVEPKLRSSLRILNNVLDMVNLKRFPDMPELKKYAQEHSKLVVHNEAQRLARDAAVDIGNKDFDSARGKLQRLYDMVQNETYIEEASKYEPSEGLSLETPISEASLNSEGKPIYPTAAGIKSFKRWFGDSKAVDKDGRPLVVYHGMPGEFKGETLYKSKYGSLGEGIYFTSDPEAASRFAVGLRFSRLGEEPKAQGNVVPAYLKIERPFDNNFFFGDKDWQGWLASLIESNLKYSQFYYGKFGNEYAQDLLKDLKNGEATLRDALFFSDGGGETQWGKDLLDAVRNTNYFDGIILEKSQKGFDEYLVFDNKQIKSAVGNAGEFSQEADSILALEVPISEADEKRVDEFIEGRVQNTPKGYIPRLNPNAPKIATLAALKYEQDGKEVPFPDSGKRFLISEMTSEPIDNDVIEEGVRRYGQIKSENYTTGQKAIMILESWQGGGFKSAFDDFSRVFRKAFVDRYNEMRRQERNLVGTENERVLLAETSASASLGQLDRARGWVSIALNYGGVKWVSGRNMITADPGAFENDDLAGYVDLDSSTPGLLEILKPLISGVVPNGLGQFKAYSTLKRVQGFRDRAKEAQFKLNNMPEDGDAATKAALKEIIAAAGKVRLVDNPSDAKISRLIEEIETEFPQVAEAHKGYQKWNNTLIQFGKDTGILTEDLAKKWQDWGDYFPFYEEMEEAVMRDQGFRQKSSMTKADFLTRALTDKAKDLEDTDPFEMISKNTFGIITAGLKNVAANRILRNSVLVDEARMITGPKPAKQAAQLRERGSYIKTTFVEGKEVYYEIADPLLHESMMNYGEPVLNTITKILAMPSNVLREMVTRDPGFIGANMLKDTISAFVTSGTGYIPVIDTFKQFAMGDIETIIKTGVAGGYDFSADPQDLLKYIKEQYRKQGINMKSQSITSTNAVRKMWDWLGDMSTRSDAANRMAVYNSVLEKTGSEAAARLAAIEVINFSRRGSNPLWRVVTASVPFLNARIQGLDVIYRSFRGQYSPYDGLEDRAVTQKRALQRGAMLAAMTGVYFVLMHDNEEYKKARREIRDDNWLIPIPSGNGQIMLKLAIPFEIGMMFKAIPETFLNFMFGDMDARGFRDSLVRQVSNSTNLNITGFQIVKPLLDVYRNKNSFTKQDIVPFWVAERIEAAEQYDERTSLISRELGQLINISPMKLDYLVGGYGGSLGLSLFLMTDKIIKEVAGEKTAGTRADYTDVNNIPAIRRFFYDAGTAGSRQQQEFYELRDESDTMVGTLKRIAERGDIAKYYAYANSRRGLAETRNEVLAIERYLDRYRKTREAILKAGLSPEQTREYLAELEADKDLRLTVVPILRERGEIPSRAASAIFEAFTG